MKTLPLPAAQPVDPLAVVTVLGRYKAGIPARIVAGEGITVYLGSDCVETKLADFTLEFTDVKRGKTVKHRLGGFQFGRDFVFATS